MSATVNAVQFRCDWCGILSPERPLSPDGIIINSPLPDGWTGIGYGAARNSDYYKVELKDSFGMQIGNLCPACSARTAGELITWLGSLPSKETDV